MGNRLRAKPEELLIEVHNKCLLYGDGDLEGVKDFVTYYPHYLNTTFVGAAGYKGTLLHFACFWAKPSIVQFLLSQPGIDVNILLDYDKNYPVVVDRYLNNCTAKEVALKRGYLPIAKLFDEKE
eukprot:TRINITY_DN20606_c0_g1_i1.p1 TRINITY_DN20606_c0_g1~~TRINITY_DN20606_c0_g1_i1.p1  ORF type:complete len:124 (+),score=34.28 TRINITY_DN20606_c0_g1_i1:3-374(+)